MKKIFVLLLILLLALPMSFALDPSPEVDCCQAYMSAYEEGNKITLKPYCEEYEITLENCETTIESWEKISGEEKSRSNVIMIVVVLFLLAAVVVAWYLLRKKK